MNGKYLMVFVLPFVTWVCIYSDMEELESSRNASVSVSSEDKGSGLARGGETLTE